MYTNKTHREGGCNGEEAEFKNANNEGKGMNGCIIYKYNSGAYGKDVVL